MGHGLEDVTTESNKVGIQQENKDGLYVSRDPFEWLTFPKRPKTMDSVSQGFPYIYIYTYIYLCDMDARGFMISRRSQSHTADRKKGVFVYICVKFTGI